MSSTVTLGSLATFRKGAGLSKSDLQSDGRVPCIHYGELFTKYGAVIDTPRSRTNADLPVNSIAGDVLMPTSDVTPRGLAKASAILQDGVTLGGDILVIRPDGACIDSRYLAHAIRNDANQVLKLVRGSTVYHLYAADMRHFELSLPPMPQQTRAADALQDVDDLIAMLERLAGKKLAVKRGIMQQLLTGRTRLPGFTDRWGVTRLGEHFEITSSKRIFQREWRSSGVPFYRARELAILGEIGAVDNDLFIDRALFEKYKRLHGAPSAGDFLVTGVGTLGKTYVVGPADEFYFKDGNIIWFKRSDTVDSRFLKYLFEMPQVQDQVHGESAGTTVGTYTITNAKRTRIPLVPIEEQRAIAIVLQDIDSEIAVLRARLGKARAIKTGMMQQLLTRRTHLPVGTAS